MYKRQSLTGALKVGVNETLLEFMLIDVIKEFRLLAPEVSFEVEILDAYRLKAKLKDSEIDIGISFNTGDYPSPLIALPLTASPLGLFASPTLQINESCFFLPGSAPELSVCLLYTSYFSPPLKLKWSEQVISKEYVRLRDVRSKHHEACRSRM